MRHRRLKEQMMDLDEKLTQFQAVEFLKWGTGMEAPTAWETAGVMDDALQEIERRLNVM